MDTVEVPDRLAEDLVLYIRKNNGTLCRQRRENEFGKLTDSEVVSMQEIVREGFNGYAEHEPVLQKS